ncbi:RBBP9/YdeN family alpha/beta hydrolase [Sphingomonas abietis]|uniref:Alpha/beta hydrolase n=1 Tax=Sphingomonas abietis TaxID=3012344 RepID=A0ABY7NPP4_9SPHN|nr:alpha/beta fold hydrolase [Sphingomonas abietis]WBO22925.1 alpha/beta hydrolase [Sphingomonas abietis]
MTSKFDELIIPGLFDSGPEHWQSHWLRNRPQALKVDLGAWDDPTTDQWVARLDRAIARRRQPVFLVAHSLGCLAVAWWAQQASTDRLHKVKAALLVTPPDVDRPDAHRLVRRFAPAPGTRLPFPSILVASRSDPHASFSSVADLAQLWGARLIDAGDAGHINVESGADDWPDGIALLDRLRLDHARHAGSSHVRVPARHPIGKRNRPA